MGWSGPYNLGTGYGLLKPHGWGEISGNTLSLDEELKDSLSSNFSVINGDYSNDKSAHIKIKDRTNSLTTLFSRKFWDNNSRIMVYYNDTGESVLIPSFEFNACACNSGGREFVDPEKVNHSAHGNGFAISSVVVVRKGSEFKCSKVSKNDISPEKDFPNYYTLSNDREGYTGFGDPVKMKTRLKLNSDFYSQSYREGKGGGSKVEDIDKYVSDNGYQTCSVSVQDCPVIGPGCTAFVIIGVSGYKSSDYYEVTTVAFTLQEDNFRAKVVPETSSNWVWVRRGGKWVRELNIKKFSGGIWSVIE